MIVCPLRLVTSDPSGCNPENTHTFELCYEEECGWWDKADECCAMLSINRSLRVIAEAPALHKEE